MARKVINSPLGTPSTGTLSIAARPDTWESARPKIEENFQQLFDATGAPASTALLQVVEVGDTAYTLLLADLGKRHVFTSETRVTVTLPAEFPRGWNAELFGERAQIILAAAPGATSKAYLNRVMTAGAGVEIELAVIRNATGVNADWSINGDDMIAAAIPVAIVNPYLPALPPVAGIVQLLNDGLWLDAVSFIRTLYVDGVVDARGTADGQFDRPSEADVGKTYRWGVIGVGVFGNSAEIFTEFSPEIQSGVVVPEDPADPPLPPILPMLFGFPGVGQTVTSNYGHWDGDPTTFSQEWFRYDNNTDTSTGGTSLGAAGSDFAATKITVPNNAGKYIRCKVIATNPAGPTPTWSLPIGPITVAPAQRTIYFGVAALGAGDGATAGAPRAWNQANLSAAVTELLGTGEDVNGRIYLNAGDYSAAQIKLNTGGGSNATWPLIIEADAGALFTGTRTDIVLPADPDAVTLIGQRLIDAGLPWLNGGYFILIGDAIACSNVHFKGFKLKRVLCGFRIQKTCSNIQITNCTGTNINTLCDVQKTGAPESPVTKLYIRGCSVDGIGEYCIRAQYASRQILIENCTLNGHRLTQDPATGWSVGFNAEDTCQDMFWNGGSGTNMYSDAGFKDLRGSPNQFLADGVTPNPLYNPTYNKRFYTPTAPNVIDGSSAYSAAYWNADVIDANGKAGQANLTVAHATMSRCTDAGVDAKCNNVLCFKVAAIQNKRNFKAWGSAGGDWNIVNCTSDNPVKLGGSGSAVHLDPAGGVDLGVCGLVCTGVAASLIDFTDGGVHYVRLFDITESGTYTGSRTNVSSSVAQHLYEVADLNPRSGTACVFSPTVSAAQTVAGGVAFTLSLDSATADVKIEVLDGIDKASVIPLSGINGDKPRTLTMPAQNYTFPLHPDNKLHWRVRVRNKYRVQEIVAIEMTVTVGGVGAFGPAAYVRTTQHGNGSGDSWANAGTFDSIPAMLQRVDDGGTVYVRADEGSYDGPLQATPRWSGNNRIMTAAQSGSDSAHRKKVMGVDVSLNPMLATIRGTRGTNGSPAGDYVFRFADGAAHLEFSYLQINHTLSAFIGYTTIGVAADDIHVHHCGGDYHDRWVDNKDHQGCFTNSSFKFLTLRGTAKGGVRLRGGNIGGADNNLLVEDSTCTGLDPATGLVINYQDFSVGFGVDDSGLGTFRGGTCGVIFNRCTASFMQDNRGATHYGQGDGFGTEKGNDNIQFNNCVSHGNGDGSYDGKGSNVTFDGCNFYDSKKNFRMWAASTFWGFGDTIIKNSISTDPLWRFGTDGARHFFTDGAYVNGTNAGDYTFINHRFVQTVTPLPTFWMLDSGTVGGTNDIVVRFAGCDFGPYPLPAYTVRPLIYPGGDSTKIGQSLMLVEPTVNAIAPIWTTPTAINGYRNAPTFIPLTISNKDCAFRIVGGANAADFKTVNRAGIGGLDNSFTNVQIGQQLVMMQRAYVLGANTFTVIVRAMDANRNIADRTITVTILDQDMPATLLMNFEGANGSTAIIDEASPAHAVTVVGNAKISTTNPPTGTSCLLLDGNGDYLQLPTSDDWWFQDEFYITGKINLATYSSGSQGKTVLISVAGVAASNNYSWAVIVTTTGQLIFQYSTNGNTTTQVASAAGVILLNTAQDIHVERDYLYRIRVFVDGVMVASGTAFGAFKKPIVQLRIGSLNNTATNGQGYMNGIWDRLKLVKGTAVRRSDATYTVT